MKPTQQTYEELQDGELTIKNENKSNRIKYTCSMCETNIWGKPDLNVCLWAKFSPSLQSARLWSVNTLGRFHSVIKYGLLTMARYDRPMNG